MDGNPPTYEELLDLTRRQAAMIEVLRAEVERLKKELEEAKRAEKRQAAPFFEGSPKADSKRPGRKAGHPPSQRSAPSPEEVDRTIDVPLPPECPECHAPLAVAPVVVYDQHQNDLPEPKPVVTRFRIPVARCPACYRRVPGRHPEQTSDALGAASVQFGPQLLGLAADLKHRLGLPYRKAAQAIGTRCGVSVAPSALVRSGHRLRRLARPSYDSLVEAARRSPILHADETGWSVGSRSASLWVFADRHVTIYLIRRSRGHEVVEVVLGEGYRGVLISDCFPAYDPLPYLKGKCLTNLLRRCSEVARSKARGAVRFPRRVSALLRGALPLKRRRGQLSGHGYAVMRGRLLAAWRRLLSGHCTDPDNARLARLLRKHRDDVLRFLDHNDVVGTNHLAEQDVRPAVLAREVSGGNRTDAGAETHAGLASILRACCCQGRDISRSLGDLLRLGQGTIVPLLHTRPSGRSPTALVGGTIGS